jgi:hypothetical protein
VIDGDAGTTAVQIGEIAMRLIDQNIPECEHFVASNDIDADTRDMLIRQRRDTLAEMFNDDPECF